MLKLTKGNMPLNAEEATQALISASIASMTEGWSEEQSETAVGAAMDAFTVKPCPHFR